MCINTEGGVDGEPSRPPQTPQEELDKQNPIIEDIDQQLHRVTSKLKSNNAKLKGLVLQVRGLG